MATKIAVKKKVEPTDDGGKKDKKVKIKGKALPTQYGMYSGIVNEKGAKDNPTEGEAISNMVDYMKNNNMPASDNPSNVYRPKFSHIGVNYNRKKKQDNA